MSECERFDDTDSMVNVGLQSTVRQLNSLRATLTSGSIRVRSYHSHDVARRCFQVRHFLLRDADTLSLDITMASQYELANRDATNDYRNVYMMYRHLQ